jgi:hypothetical protein
MRSTRRMLATAAVTVASTGLLVAGAGSAWADEHPPTPAPTHAPITLSPEQSAQVCDVRIPRLLDRIAKLQTRIGGDASVAGSTARLQQRLQKAEDAGRTEVADRLQKRLDDRPKQVDRLAAAKTRIETFRDEKCG